MTDIEDLVQSTTRALAGTVGAVRPLPPLPEEPALDEVSRRRRLRMAAPRARRWLIPLAAAASVVAIVAVSVIAAHLTGSSGSRGATAATAAAPRPEFYMTAEYPSAGPNVLRIEVRRTADGAVTGSTTIPASNMGWGNNITAAANDRAFFIGYYPCHRGTPAVTTFYRIAVTASGQISGMSAVGHVQGMLDYLAVSPDGSQMAYTALPGDCLGGAFQSVASVVGILNLSTGAVRTWQEPAPRDTADGLSWAPDGGTLVVDERTPGARGLTVLGLNTASSGGSLQADSTTLLRNTCSLSDCVTAAVAGPGDSLTALELQAAGRQLRQLVVRIPLQAGSPQTVLYSQLNNATTAVIQGGNGLFADPSGQWVLLWPAEGVSDRQGALVFAAGWISGGRLHHLPGAGQVFPEGIAW